MEVKPGNSLHVSFEWKRWKWCVTTLGHYKEIVVYLKKHLSIEGGAEIKSKFYQRTVLKLVKVSK